jgi:predicted DNA-binding WGR domain protein
MDFKRFRTIEINESGALVVPRPKAATARTAPNVPAALTPSNIVTLHKASETGEGFKVWRMWVNKDDPRTVTTQWGHESSENHVKTKTFGSTHLAHAHVHVQYRKKQNKGYKVSR